jgi:hypothetical protein
VARRGSTAVSAHAPDQHFGRITHTGEADSLDDRPQAPVRIWSRTGRRPLLAGGNADGGVRMRVTRLHVPRRTCRRDAVAATVIGFLSRAP